MSMDTDDRSYLGFSLRYAFRNLWRNSRRSILTISTVVFAVSVAIVANRYSAAIMKLWQDGAADTGSAHAQIHKEGYWQKQEGVQYDLTLKGDAEFEMSIRADANVEAVVQRLELEGIISTGNESMYFVGKGVEPLGEMAVSPRLFTHNDAGEFVRVDDPATIVVGRGLAESLKIKIGDEVTLITQTIAGSVNGIDATVVGVVDAAIPSFSKRVVYAHIELLQKLIRMPDRYTELAVRLKPGVDVERWVKANQPMVARTGSELRGWWDIEPIIHHVETIWDSVVVVITGLLFLSSGLSVLNIIFMMVAERTVEIGTLMAIGARQIDVSFLFSLEAAIIGLIGGLIGAVFGNAAVFAMDFWGVPFESPFGAGELIVHPQIDFTVAALMCGAALMICSLAAIPPALKAARVEPLRAFRGQVI